MLYIDGNGVLRHRDDELMHHGVKGMKWGVRRYLNKSGQLTGMGRRRLRYDNAKYRDLDTKLAAKQERLSTKTQSNRVTKKLDRIKTKRDHYKKVMKLATSSLSARDIEKGMKKYRRRRNLRAILAYEMLIDRD